MPPGGWQQPIARSALPADVRLAGWWSRVGAVVLDAIFMTIVTLALWAPGIVLVVVQNGGALGITLLIVGILVSIAFWLLYAAAFMQRDGRRNGQTLGKQMAGIRVIRIDRHPMAWGTSLVRELVIKQLLFGFVGSFFGFIPTLLDYLWPLWDDQNRCLHDMVVSTHVVKA
jgi:uncharacterized RDD family membrane protein YckC